MFDNHFSGNNNTTNIYQIQIVVNLPAENKVVAKKETKSLWDRIKSISNSGSSLIDLIKKFYWIALFFFDG